MLFMIASGLVYGQFYPFLCVHCDIKSQGHEKEVAVLLMVNSIQKNKEEVSRANQLGLGNSFPIWVSTTLKISSKPQEQMFNTWVWEKHFIFKTTKNAKEISTLQIMYELDQQDKSYKL